jgi:multicomponent Na+:H+ antiporter subunit G
MNIGISIAGLGLFFWLWASAWLPSRRSLERKLHALGVADTLGSVLITLGLLICYPEQWIGLLLALGSVIFWGALLGFVLARGVAGSRSDS